MGTIVERRRKDGSRAYTAQIRIMRDGVKVHTEAQTFDRRPAASAWLKKRETELVAPGALEALKAPQVMLADAINKYLDTSIRKIGRTKAQVLETILRHPLATKSCETITSADVSSFARELQQGWTPEGEIKPRQPQTVGNYMSHLDAVFAVARPMWGYPLEQQAFRDAQVVTGRMGIISKSASRNRRPNLQELEKLLTFFADRRTRAPQAMPMDKVILFALFSTRRQEEITLLRLEPKTDLVSVAIPISKKTRLPRTRDMTIAGHSQANLSWEHWPKRFFGLRNDQRPVRSPPSASRHQTAFSGAPKRLPGRLRRSWSGW